jgi:threonine/homoserine/homoserine lactone efflux protein
MIDVSVLPLFLTTVFFLLISPGPDLVLISTYASTEGFKAGLLISSGVFLAGIVQTLLVAFGLGQLMQSAPYVVYGIKLIGALYLSYLGIMLLRSWWRNTPAHNPAIGESPASSFRLVTKGLFNNLLNPKALLFFSLLLVQFTTGASPLPPQILILGILLSTFALAVNLLFAVSFSKAARMLVGNLTLGRDIDGFLGVIFLGLAARLATSK